MGTPHEADRSCRGGLRLHRRQGAPGVPRSAALGSQAHALLAFYDFPAEHWKHLRTTNVIESSFATIRHRTVRSKGCLSNKTALAMIFKLAEAAENSWRRLDGHNQLPKIILGVKFADGVEVIRSQTQAAAA
jgi:putative transposase